MSIPIKQDREFLVNSQTTLRFSSHFFQRQHVVTDSVLTFLDPDNRAVGQLCLHRFVLASQVSFKTVQNYRLSHY